VPPPLYPRGAYVLTELDPNGPGARGGVVKGTKLLTVDGISPNSEELYSESG